MKLSRLLLVSCAPLVACALAACSSDMNANTAANSNAVTAGSPTPAAQSLSVVERPQKIKDMSAQRG